MASNMEWTDDEQLTLRAGVSSARIHPSISRTELNVKTFCPTDRVGPADFRCKLTVKGRKMLGPGQI